MVFTFCSLSCQCDVRVNLKTTQVIGRRKKVMFQLLQSVYVTSFATAHIPEWFWSFGFVLDCLKEVYFSYMYC